MIEGNKVKLRSLTPCDAEKLRPLLHNTELMSEYSGDIVVPVSLDTLKSDLNNLWKNINKDYYWAIEKHEDKEFIGCCGYNRIDWKNSFADIGIYVSPPEQSKGLGKEALSLLIKYLFLEYNLNKIKLNVHSNNTRAIALYEKLGFKREGCGRNEIFKKGQYFDLIHMGLLKCEFLDLLP